MDYRLFINFFKFLSWNNCSAYPEEFGGWELDLPYELLLRKNYILLILQIFERICVINIFLKRNCVVIKMAPIGTRTQNCFSRARRSAGPDTYYMSRSIPGRDTYYMSCSVFICALRSLYSTLNVIPLQLHYGLENEINMRICKIGLLQRDLSHLNQIS